jgi:DNA-binding transcriptional ArsR family regulator
MNQLKEETGDLDWISERRTPLLILTLLAKLRKASRYDLASQLGLSYATVMNYMRRFTEAGLTTEVGNVQAERGGKKTLFEPTQKALAILCKISPSDMSSVKEEPAVPLGFYSLSSEDLKQRKAPRKGRIESIIDEMRLDIAVVVSYEGHPYPIMPLSALGPVNQVGNVFSEEVNRRIQKVTAELAKRIAESADS